MVGALLAPGKRTVTAVLRVMGLSQEGHFQTYHRVLNRARWSSLALARVLLEMMVRTFVPAGPVVIGIDDTLERRRGELEEQARQALSSGDYIYWRDDTHWNGRGAALAAEAIRREWFAGRARPVVAQ